MSLTIGVAGYLVVSLLCTVVLVSTCVMAGKSSSIEVTPTDKGTLTVNAASFPIDGWRKLSKKDSSASVSHEVPARVSKPGEVSAVSHPQRA